MSERNRYKMKVAIAFALSFFATVLMVTTASAIPSSVDDPYRVEEFSVSGPGNLEVRTSGGHITVSASESNRVRVEMYVRKNGRDLSRSDIDLDNFNIDISQSGNTVRAIARRDNDRGWKFRNTNNISISFVVYTPREMSTDLKTSGGHIETEGLKGKQDISTSGGHLQLSNLMGTVDARTSGGHIEIRDFEGEMNARTSGGHINVENSNGSINLRTSGGHIDLERISGTIEASTSGGGINAEIANIGQFVNLRTSGGNVNISVPDGIGLDLELRGSRVRTELKNFSGKVERNEVEGTINGGGPKVSARTSGGTVRISFI